MLWIFSLPSELLRKRYLHRRVAFRSFTILQEMFSNELKKHDETMKYLDANLAAQEKILSALTEANADFSDFRKKIKTSLNT